VNPRHRALSVVRGLREDTATLAWELVCELPAAERLWVSPLGRRETLATLVDPIRPREVLGRLGMTCTAVVVDLHDGFDGDTLGRVHGFIVGGGRLVLRLPEAGHAPTGRMWRRLERVLSHTPQTSRPCAHGARPSLGPTDEQDALVDAIVGCARSPSPSVVVLTADRGRGKSAALGRTIQALDGDMELVLTGPSERAVAEVQHFARRPLAWSPPLELLARLEEGACPAAVCVDEAAQLPVPLLQALCLAAPHSHFIFSTTVHGYEGTGRGFGLRFVEWLHDQPRAVHHTTLTTPIRFGPHDPVERFVFHLLLLEAGPCDVSPPCPELRFECVDQARLASDDALLEAVFGLLVAAHYRTTPADLQRLLETPHTAIHVALAGLQPVAVGWLVQEGELSLDTIAALGRGTRLRGQVLPETLCTHAGHPEAGVLRMWRSVRTAVHPAFRRRGIARRLIAWEHQHSRHASADLLGTVFGATPALIQFRRALGYELVRLGVSRSARTGVPSAVMVRPQSLSARRLVERLRADMARDLPAQLDQMDRERGLPIEPALRRMVLSDLPQAGSWTPVTLSERVRSYVHGANPHDVVGPAVELWVDALPAHAVAQSPGRDGQAMRARVQRRLGWHEVVAEVDMGTVSATQRAVRRSLQSLWDVYGMQADTPPAEPSRLPQPPTPPDPAHAEDGAEVAQHTEQLHQRE